MKFHHLFNILDLDYISTQMALHKFLDSKLKEIQDVTCGVGRFTLEMDSKTVAS